MFLLKKLRFYLYVLSPHYIGFVDSCRTTIWMTSSSDFTLGLLSFEIHLLEPFCRLTCMQNSRKRTILYWTEDSIDSHWRHKGAWPFVHSYSCLGRPQLIRQCLLLSQVFILIQIIQGCLCLDVVFVSAAPARPLSTLPLEPALGRFNVPPLLVLRRMYSLSFLI